MRKYKMMAASTNAENSANTNSNIILDYKTLKKELDNYRRTHPKTDKFDENLVRELERKYNMRIIDVRINGDNFNGRAYLQNGTTFATTTVIIPRFREHETTLKTVKSIHQLVYDRTNMTANSDPQLEDSLTIAACDSVSDKTLVRANLNRVSLTLNQYI